MQPLKLHVMKVYKEVVDRHPTIMQALDEILLGEVTFEQPRALFNITMVPKVFGACFRSELIQSVVPNAVSLDILSVRVQAFLPLPQAKYIDGKLRGLVENWVDEVDSVALIQHLVDAKPLPEKRPDKSKLATQVDQSAIVIQAAIKVQISHPVSLLLLIEANTINWHSGPAGSGSPR